MRLIDTDVLKEYCMRASKSDDDFRRVSLATLASVIDAQPTAYDVDKVVRQLEELRELDACDFGNCPAEDIRCCDCTQKRMVERAIEIVKGGGVNEMEE